MRKFRDFDSKLFTRSLRNGTKQHGRIRRPCRTGGKRTRQSAGQEAVTGKSAVEFECVPPQSFVALIYAFNRPMYNQHRQLDHHASLFPQVDQPATSPRRTRPSEQVFQKKGKRNMVERAPGLEARESPHIASESVVSVYLVSNPGARESVCLCVEGVERRG